MLRDNKGRPHARVLRWLYATIVGYSDPHSHVRWAAVKRALNTLRCNVRPLNVLEVGSGPGAMTYELMRVVRPRSITACDIDYAWGWPAVARCLKADATHLPLVSDSHDIVMLIDVIEHIHADHEALAEAARVTVPGGYVVVSVPTPAYPLWFGRQFHERIGHVRDGYSRSQLLAALRDAGYRPVYVRPHTGLLFLLLAWLYYRHLPLVIPLPELATLAGRAVALVDTHLPSPTWGGLVVAAIKLQPHRPRRCTRERSRADSSACDFDESSRLCARGELPGDPPRA